jgi:hypothetical protein
MFLTTTILRKQKQNYSSVNCVYLFIICCLECEWNFSTATHIVLGLIYAEVEKLNFPAFNLIEINTKQ